MNIQEPEYVDDNLIFLDNKELAFRPSDVSIGYEDSTFTFNNRFGNDPELEYRYVLTDTEETIVYASEWDRKSKVQVSMAENRDGEFTLRAFIRKGENKTGFSCYRFKLTDGLIEEIQRV